MEKHPPRPTQLEAAIREIIHQLLEMPVTPHVRELRAKAVTYGRVIDNWRLYPPTTPQTQAMLECVAELREKVQGARATEVSKVTKRPERPASQPPARSGPPPTKREGAPREGAPRRTQPSVATPAPRTVPSLPSVPPPGVAWNANVSSNVSDSTGVHARRASGAGASTGNSTSSRPPPRSDTTSAPPVSAPRVVDNPTPVPELLRSRRSR